ncbi:MAG: hypothetical protein HOP04_13470 [Methylophilaceae bacterium]|nr:hypothetical protein [Methylophilaceae bacterium]
MEKEIKSISVIEEMANNEARIIVREGIAISNRLIEKIKCVESYYINERCVRTYAEYCQMIIDLCFNYTKFNGLIENLSARTVIIDILKSEIAISKIKCVVITSEEDDLSFEWDYVYLNDDGTTYVEVN